MVIKHKLTESQLKSIIKEWLDEDGKEVINESVDKTDVKELIKKELASFAKSDEFKTQIKNMVLKEVKGKDAEKYIVEITKNVLADVYKTLWLRKNTLFAGI